MRSIWNENVDLFWKIMKAFVKWKLSDILSRFWINILKRFWFQHTWWRLTEFSWNVPFGRHWFFHLQAFLLTFCLLFFFFFNFLIQFSLKNLSPQNSQQKIFFTKILFSTNKFKNPSRYAKMSHIFSAFYRLIFDFFFVCQTSLLIMWTRKWKVQILILFAQINLKNSGAFLIKMFFCFVLIRLDATDANWGRKKCLKI